MINTSGRQRVVITNVAPQVDCGKYRAKATIQDELVISADVFTDGHDEVGASVLLKHQKEKKWTEIPRKVA